MAPGLPIAAAATTLVIRQGDLHQWDTQRINRPYDVAHDIVRVHGDTAVVVDRFGEGLATRATWVAVKRNGQWRVIFEQFSKLAEP